MSGEGFGTVETSSGDSRICLSNVQEDIEIDSKSGSIELEIPKDFSFELKATTRSGEISSNMEEALSYDKDGEKVTGTIGDNPKSRITLSSSSGDIDLYHN